MNDIKHIVSLRIINSDRAAVQAIASRLFVRESDVYRFSINFMLNRFQCLFDDACTGSDLLPALLEIRAEINHSLGLKRNQLEKIINGSNINPEKYVAMCDIELLLLPYHLLKQRLSKLDGTFRGHLDAEVWLKAYLTDKYKLDNSTVLSRPEDMPLAGHERPELM